MAQDRKADRHSSVGQHVRIQPADLWVSLGEQVGDRERSRVLSELIAYFLGEGPMPVRPWLEPGPGESGSVT